MYDTRVYYMRAGDVLRGCARVALRVTIKKMYLYCMAMVTEVFTPAMFRAMAAKGYTQEDLCLRVGWSRRKIVDNFTM